MNINVLVMALLATIVGLYTWKAYLHRDDPAPSQLPWVPIDVNKPRSFVNQVRDAGLYTERTRRAAIINNPTPVFSYKGSTNGSLEVYFLSSILTTPRPVICPAPEYIADGGNVDSEVCDILDGSGSDVLDFGDSGTNVCD